MTRQVRVLDVYKEKPARPPRGPPKTPLHYIHLYVLTSVALQDIIGNTKRQGSVSFDGSISSTRPSYHDSNHETDVESSYSGLSISEWHRTGIPPDIKPSAPGTLPEKYARGSSALPLSCGIDSVDRLRGCPSSSSHLIVSVPKCSLLPVKILAAAFDLSGLVSEQRGRRLLFLIYTRSLSNYHMANTPDMAYLPSIDMPLNKDCRYLSPLLEPCSTSGSMTISQPRVRAFPQGLAHLKSPNNDLDLIRSKISDVQHLDTSLRSTTKYVSS